MKYRKQQQRQKHQTFLRCLMFLPLVLFDKGIHNLSVNMHLFLLRKSVRMQKNGKGMLQFPAEGSIRPQWVKIIEKHCIRCRCSFMTPGPHTGVGSSSLYCRHGIWSISLCRLYIDFDYFCLAKYCCLVRLGLEGERSQAFLVSWDVLRLTQHISHTTCIVWDPLLNNSTAILIHKKCTSIDMFLQ